MSRDELAVMDGSKCILQLRGVRPFLSDKFDITKHKRYKELSDFDKKNEEKQPETDTSAKVNLSKETPVETETAEVSKDQEAPEAPTEIPSTETKSETSEGDSTEA